MFILEVQKHLNNAARERHSSSIQLVCDPIFPSTRHSAWTNPFRSKSAPHNASYKISHGAAKVTKLPLGLQPASVNLPYTFTPRSPPSTPVPKA